MPTMQDSISVAANALSANVLSGLLYEFVDDGQNVTVSATGSATGLRASFIAGVPICDDIAINLQNRFPIVPDDVLTSGEVPGGRLILRFRNTTGGALTAFWRIDL